MGAPITRGVHDWITKSQPKGGDKKSEKKKKAAHSGATFAAFALVVATTRTGKCQRAG